MLSFIKVTVRFEPRLSFLFVQTNTKLGAYHQFHGDAVHFFVRGGYMTGPTPGGLFPSAADVRNYYHLRKVASVGLYVQQSTNSGREGYRKYKTLPVLT